MLILENLIINIVEYTTINNFNSLDGNGNPIVYLSHRETGIDINSLAFEKL